MYIQVAGDFSDWEGINMRKGQQQQQQQGEEMAVDWSITLHLQQGRSAYSSPPAGQVSILFTSNRTVQHTLHIQQDRSANSLLVNLVCRRSRKYFSWDLGVRQKNSKKFNDVREVGPVQLHRGETVPRDFFTLRVR